MIHNILIQNIDKSFPNNQKMWLIYNQKLQKQEPGMLFCRWYSITYIRNHCLLVQNHRSQKHNLDPIFFSMAYLCPNLTNSHRCESIKYIQKSQNLNRYGITDIRGLPSQISNMASYTHRSLRFLIDKASETSKCYHHT